MKKIMLLIWLIASIVHAEKEFAGVLFSSDANADMRVILPLKKTIVDVDVTAGIARTEVVQRFENTASRPLEAIYIFPLPSEAAIEDFHIRLNDRVIRSSVKEKEQAKATYEKAKSEGRRAALLEQERPNIFTTSVAHIMPNETVEICFSYVEQLRFRKDHYDITFPMVVGERYIPFKFDPRGTSKNMVADGERINPPVLHPNLDDQHRLLLNVTLQGLPVENVESTTHAISTCIVDEDVWRIKLKAGETIPNSEFNLSVNLRENEEPFVSFVESAGRENYGILSVFPPVGAVRKHKALPKDVVFLIDTSGSMSGESIAQAKSGLKRCIEILGEGDRFSVVRFSSDFSGFSPELRPVTADKLAAVQDYIAGLSSGGGTEMQPALEYVLNMLPQESERMPLVIFLTDGDVGNEDSLLNLLSQKLGNTRLFTFGIGSAPNEFLMHRMAEAGRGQSRFIRSHEDVGTVMSDFFQTLEAPVLTDVAVEWVDATVHAYPERCPDIFYGRPLQLTAKAKNNFGGKVVITGLLEGEKQTYVVNLDEHKGEEHDSIEKLYGRMQIKDLMVQMIQTDDLETEEELKQSIIQAALRHQLVSKYTSRVAVEERKVVAAGQLISVRVPVQAPKGWAMYSTASNETLQLLIGALLMLGALGVRRLIRAA